MHGIGGNASNWGAQLPAFAPHFACAAWDARGYGASDDYDGPLAFDDFVADLLRVLDHFGVARAHLVGLSMGGRIAMRTALLHPERVATLTLVDTHEGFEAFTPEQRRAFVDSRRAPLLAGKTPADIAEPVARSLVGPKATAEHPPARRQHRRAAQGLVHQVARGHGQPGRRSATSPGSRRRRISSSAPTIR